MKSKLAFLAASATVTAASSPAMAQLAPGYSGHSSAPIEGSTRDYWWLISELGYCLADSKQAKAIAFLGAEPDSREEDKAFDALFNRYRNVCMRNFVSATVLREHVRGAIAEALYRKLQGVTGAAGIAAQPGSGPAGGRTAIHEFARCYVSEHRADANALLKETRLGTSEERSRVRAMANDFGPCLPAGVEVKIVPTDIRFALSEALYAIAASENAQMTQGSN